MRQIIIGLVGEDPNDTASIKNLLQKRYPPDNFTYIPLLRNIHGSQLDSQKTKHLLRHEYESEAFDIIIFIRDLDGTMVSNTEMQRRRFYFMSSNRVVDRRGIFLLNTYSIEALIFADIESFNINYDCTLQVDLDPMLIYRPKDLLKNECKKYNESLNPKVFAILKFQALLENCAYFQSFISKFERMIKKIKE